MRFFHRHEFITLAEAAPLLPGAPTETTLRYWSHSGANGVQLRTYEMDDQCVTTVTDILQFIADQNRGEQLPEEIEEYYRRCEAEIRRMKERHEEASAISKFEDGYDENGESPNDENGYVEEPKIWGIAGRGCNDGNIIWLSGIHPLVSIPSADRDVERAPTHPGRAYCSDVPLASFGFMRHAAVQSILSR